jgi:hypothetical protein
VSWQARCTDDGERLRRVKLIGLKGTRDKLEHERDLIRLDWAYARRHQQHAEAQKLEQQINANLAAWNEIIQQIRAIQAERAA